LLGRYFRKRFQPGNQVYLGPLDLAVTREYAAQRAVHFSVRIKRASHFVKISHKFSLTHNLYREADRNEFASFNAAAIKVP
jgi:hypothetical protein